MLFRTIRTFFFLFMAFFISSCENSDQKIIAETIPPPPKIDQCIDFDLKSRYFSADTVSLLQGFANESKTNILDNDIYTLMTQAFFRRDGKNMPDSLCTKIVLKTQTYKGEITLETISKLYPDFILQDDILYMYSQLSCEDYFWDTHQLPNTIGLTSEELERIFDDEDAIKNWEEFIGKYGLYGLHNFSKPIFNKAENIALVIHEGNGGCTLGSGTMYIVKKGKYRWRIVKEIELWIS